MATLEREVLFVPVVLCPLVAEEEQILRAICAARAMAGSSGALNCRIKEEASPVSACHAWEDYLLQDSNFGWNQS